MLAGKYVAGLPSALNRAGRIFGRTTASRTGIPRQGIDEARKLSDGWFWFANLIEYAELSYKVWLGSGRQAIPPRPPPNLARVTGRRPSSKRPSATTNSRTWKAGGTCCKGPGPGAIWTAE